MRLADDDRGRVPFALIGVLLLTSSVALATVRLDGGQVNRDAALAGDRAEATAETTLRDAVRDAGARAAANPVITPAEAAYGEVLDPERPYRSYLELLVAIELRERLGRTTQRVGTATASVDLPPIEDPASAASAIDAVHVEPAGRGLVAATVSDVPIVVRQDGAVVGRRHASVSATVTTPALTLHERTATFRSRLNGGTLEPGTLTRGLTGSLWSFAWARGYAQYLGIPFENVVTNDHVELLTNLAVLDVQRSVFGSGDGRAHDRLADRTAEVAANEGIGVASRAFEAAALPTNASAAVDAPTVDSPDPPTRTVGVNRTADLALADVIEVAPPEVVDSGAVDLPTGRTPTIETFDDEIVPPGADPWPYAHRAIVRTASSIETRLLTERRAADATLASVDPAVSSDWERDAVVNPGDPSVASVRNGTAPVPDSAPGWSTHVTAERTVVVERTDVVRYRNRSSDEVTLVEERYTRAVDVGVALVYRPVQRDWIPDAEADLDRGAYAAQLDEAGARLVGDRGGTAGIVRSVATGGELTDAATVPPASVEELSSTAYGETADLRERLRGVATTASTAHALTEEESPHAELHATVRDRSERYRGVPPSYATRADRATAALRSVYLDRVLWRLDARSDGSDGAREDVASKVDDVSQVAGVGFGDLFEVGMDYRRPEPTLLEARDPAPDLALTVDADPSYLSTERVNDTRVPTPDYPYHPMSARTTTISSLPTEELTGRITEAIVSVFGDDEVEKAPLPMAARTLQSADRLEEEEVEERGFADDRDALAADVEEELRDLEDEVAATLADETALDGEEANAVVGEALAVYDRPAGAVLAFDDGSASTRIATLAAERPGVDETDADRARTVIRATVVDYLAEDDSSVKLGKVESVSRPTRDAIEDAVGSVVERADETGEELVRREIVERTGFSVLPSRGFPVAPVPQWWVVTANVWHVDVHGTYASFVVRADQGGPTGDGHVSYVRDGQSVLVDVDGDGAPETLGRSDRIDFHATTTVAVAVPRGGGGVGNDGTGFRSSTDGWESDVGIEDDCDRRLDGSSLEPIGRCRDD